MSGHTPESKVKATETTLSVIDALEELDGGRVNEVADHLGIAASTAHRHLSTLYRNDYVTKEGDSYRLGFRFLTVGGHVQTGRPEYRLAETTVDGLAAETGERAQFLVEEHGYRIYLHTAAGERAVQTDSHVGKRGPLHCSAAGKAILAAFPESRVAEILDRHGLVALTPNTVTDREELLAELETVAERGYAYNREESTEGLHAVGTAVLAPEGTVIGGLSVSGPAHRLKGDRLRSTVPDLLLGAANELELNIEYDIHSR